MNAASAARAATISRPLLAARAPSAATVSGSSARGSAASVSRAMCAFMWTRASVVASRIGTGILNRPGAAR